MFGCGLPVCAARYSCIDELVSENSTGLLFDCAQELSLQLVELLQGFPHRPSNKLQHMQQNIQQNTQRWPTTWAGIAPIFT